MRAGTLVHSITIENPPAIATPDGEGGWREEWTVLAVVKAAITIAPAAEGRIQGTVNAIATHQIKIRYLPGVTTRSRVRYDGRTFNLTSVENRNEFNREMRLNAAEVLP